MSNVHAVGDKVEVTGVVISSEASGDTAFTRKHTLTIDTGDATYSFKVGGTWERSHRGFSSELGYMIGNTLQVKATVAKTTYFYDGSAPTFNLEKVSLRKFTLGTEALKKREEVIEYRTNAPCKDHLVEELREKRDAATKYGLEALTKAASELLDCNSYENRVCSIHGNSLEYPVTTPAK